MIWYSLLLGLAILARWVLTSGRRPKGYPPGPPTLPVIGNLHQMPGKDAHLQFEKWAREYGPVYSLMLGTKTMIVLSGDQAIKDLLDKKSAVYSDRPELYIGQTLASGDLRFLMMGYGAKWRAIRKMMHKILNISTARSYVPYQMLENKQMLYQFLQEPENFLHHIRRYSNALTTTMVFGWRTSTYEDEKMKQLFDGFSQFADLNQQGAAAMVDFFPILRRLPEFLLPTKRKAKILHQHEKALYLSHWLNAKKSIEAGTIPPCFCVGVAEAQKKDGFTDDEACYISGTLLEAGSDTTSSTLYAFIQAMVLYPDVQKLAQEEIERVVGSKRLPTMEDADDLPFIRCCVKETLRWMPTTILGAVPHAANQDDIYMGYVIPKGAAVMNNVWSINMDPSRYENPRKYDPRRFGNNTKSLYDSAVDPDVSQRDQFTFGAGRRICPGIHVAERSLFLGISRVLWSFDITPALNKDGSLNMPDPEKLTQGFVCMPEKFKAMITVRSQERSDLITREWHQAENEFLDPQTKQWAKIPDEVRNATSG